MRLPILVDDFTKIRNEVYPRIGVGEGGAAARGNGWGEGEGESNDDDDRIRSWSVPSDAVLCLFGGPL